MFLLRLTTDSAVQHLWQYGHREPAEPLYGQFISVQQVVYGRLTARPQLAYPQQLYTTA